jgi:very-short-patch-repair endonuclease
MDGNRRIWTTADLRAAGLDRRTVSAAVEQKKLHVIRRGLYVTDDDAHLILQALARGYPGITFTGRTAAFLYRALPMTWPATAEHPTNRHSDHLIDIRRRVGRPTRQVGWATVAVPALVALNLPAEDAVRVLENGYAGFTGTRRLEEDLAQLSERERTLLDPVLRTAVLGTASQLEQTAVTASRKALAEEVDRGLVTVGTNTLFRGYWFDVMIREARVLVEIDSYAFHGEGKARKSAFVRDRHKGNQATRWGWLLLRYPDHAVKNLPDYVGAEVADTVRFALAHDRMRRDDEALDTDRPVQEWYPEV